MLYTILNTESSGIICTSTSEQSSSSKKRRCEDDLVIAQKRKKMLNHPLIDQSIDEKVAQSALEQFRDLRASQAKKELLCSTCFRLSKLCL